MEGKNLVILVGNLVDDAELKHTTADTALCKFRMATNSRYKDKSGEWTDKATYHDIIIWGKRAEWLARSLFKGNQVYVDGRIENGSYEKDGIKRFTSSVVADKVLLMSNSSRQDEPEDDDPWAN